MSEKLHNALLENELYTKSYDDFKSQFSTVEKQTLLYENLKQEGLYTKSTGDFLDQFFPITEEQQEAESESEEKEDSKETKVAKAKAVQAIVNRVLQAVEMAGGDTDTTKLALMGMLGNQAFRSYQRQSIPDVAFYDTTVSYESPSYNDPLGNVFNLGSNQMMDAMTNSQYE